MKSPRQDHLDYQVKKTYQHLKESGVLTDEETWRLADKPDDVEYAHVSVEESDDWDQNIADGYSVDAWVIVKREMFYVTRVGGFAGWHFLAGPFQVHQEP